jgi:thiosulfate reductase cytochrome b subunit
MTVIFSFLRFPDNIVIGKWAQYGLQWHFVGMRIFVLNGFAYLSYGIATGRFWRKLFPISLREVLVTIGQALRFRLRHDDFAHYNAVQKVLYLGVMTVGVLIRDIGLGAVEAGAIIRTGQSVRQLPKHSPGAFLLHGRNRGFHRGACERTS